MKLLNLFFVLSSISFSNTISAQSLKIQVSGIRQQKGEIMLALFDKSDGFPFETSNVYKLMRGIPERGVINFVVDPLPRGKYAVALFHDSNGDGKLNVNIFGIPKEGYGVSNNAYNTFSSPRYADASFEHEKNTLQKIVMRY